jgi:hypothetical protein
MVVRVAVIVIVPLVMFVMVVMVVAVIVSVGMFVDRLHAGSDRHFRWRLRIEFPADQQHQRRAGKRQQRYQPNQV